MLSFSELSAQTRASVPAAWQDVLLNDQVFIQELTAALQPVSLNVTLHLADLPPKVSTDHVATSLGLRERLAALGTTVEAFLNALDDKINKVTALLRREHHLVASQVASLAQDCASAKKSVDGAMANELSTKVQQLLLFASYHTAALQRIMHAFDHCAGFELTPVYMLWPPKEEAFLLSSLQSLAEKLEALVAAPLADLSNVDLRNNGFDASLHDLTLQLPHQRVLISLSGPHGTDIIGSVLKCVAKYGCAIEDFMFSRLYHQVTFGVLVTLTSRHLKIYLDLCQAAEDWEANLGFEIFDTPQHSSSQSIRSLRQHFRPRLHSQHPPKKAEANADNPTAITRWIQEAPYAGRKKYACTVFNQHGLSAAFLDEWTAFLLAGKISVEKMTRLDREPVCSAIDYVLSVPQEQDMALIREDLIAMSLDHQVDIALQPHNVYRRNKRLVVFDMDSTLIQQEVIDEIARQTGITEQVAAITERAMNGEIDFKESLKARVQLLVGTPVADLDQVKRRLVFTEGARLLCKALKRLGFKLAVISGGFIPFANYVKQELQLDYAFANTLQVSADGQTLTGRTTGMVIDAERKAELLQVIAQAESVALDQVVAIGDGANDLLMLAKAGLGVAFNAKPNVQKKANTRINQKSLKYVLYLLGYSEEECMQLTDDRF
ncbi:Phosphoserine phosphatase [Dimargaris verticillata]|uniref:phosphoserine phosphatase n=1 Tax=Dimargaris verticillata TaxID=2761393 RepID=A0A9W8E696_9FUNG|nr:Phosphoserine phosphatase [Dimargaris verticillata]